MMEVDVVKEALQRLYDTPALASSRLAAELAATSRTRPGDVLHAALLAGIARLKPPDGTPRRSTAWRRYRYLQLRYVDCASHEAAATDLALSLRQASRVHREALAALAGALDPAPRPTTAPPPVPTADLVSELQKPGLLEPEGLVDFAEAVRGVRDTVAGVAADHSSAVELALPPGLPPVLVNRVALRQVLLNLLLHMLGREGRVPGPIRLAAEAGAQELDVTLFDDSPGTPLPGASSEPLVAARVIAEQQGAEVRALPDGALLLRLPRGALRTVLVLDDNPDVGVLFQRMLARSWYRPMPVRTAPHALTIAIESPPDAIVLDVVMPGQDGWEVLATLKANSTTAAIPVVVCSVLPDRELAFSLGAADFLAKPVTRPALLAVLDGLFAAD